MVTCNNISLDQKDIAIETRDLNIYYGSKHAIKNLSMQIKKLDITAFIGPSGCGKSTYLRALNRMNDLIPITKTTGKILFDGININDKNVDLATIRQKIGMVWQKPNPFNKSIYENIVFALKYYGIRQKQILDEIVEDSLRKVALWDEVKDRLHKSALALSGGQQQRLCIARAIATKPEILLLDEPTSALDPISSGKIEELLFELKQDYTIIIVTHNMQQAGRISSYTAFFLLGDLIEYDETNVIFTNPVVDKTNDYIMGRFG
ncbi:MAG: phosphate transport system ATP-binding protein [Clostridiales bacterium]|nr:phosphate transport system ATP-binding protein [Clostridiales bacterium]MDK2933675.1 phosphate transport system ATP-binding protein [Clostridiales bacterium]